MYGSDEEEAASLREGKGGLLKTYLTKDKRTLLPQDEEKQECEIPEVLQEDEEQKCFIAGTYVK